MYTKILSYKESSKFMYLLHRDAKDSYINLYTDRKNDATYIWLLKEENIIGFLSYVINEIMDSKKAFIYIVKVFILERFRGQELSHILFNKIEEIEDEQRNLNINVLTLVAANQELEEKLYKKIGFKGIVNQELIELYSKIIRTRDPIMYKLKQQPKVEMTEKEKQLFGEK